MSFRFVASARLPTEWGEFEMHGFQDPETGEEHIALTIGNFEDDEPVLARIHSECLTGDALHSLRCDCGKQLASAMEVIARLGHGVILYLRQEGRGIGLINKIRAYQLQDSGADTVEANEQLGFGADLRDYAVCQVMFEHIGVQRIRLLTNNPLKVAAMEQVAGVEVVERVSLQTESNPHNARYLKTKAGKLGHMLDD